MTRLLAPSVRASSRALSLVVLLGSALAAPAQTPTPTPTITPTPTATPITTLVPAGSVLYGAPNGGRYDCSNIHLDADGSIWSASANENVLLQLSPDRTKVKRWTMPVDAAPSSLLKDGNAFWVTELGGFHVARFVPETGVLTEWADAARRPSALVKRPDGTFWLPETSGVLTKFDPASGVFTYYRALGVNSLTYPFLDSDGSLWSADFIYGVLVRFSPDGSKVTRWTLPDTASYPAKIIRGFDGGLWISLYNTGALARFDPATNEFKQWALGAASLPFELLSYRNRIVYSDQGGGNVGFFDPSTAGTAPVIKTLEPSDVETTLISTVTSTPVDTTLTLAEDDVTSVPLPVTGANTEALTEVPSGGSIVYGMAVDPVRARFFYGTVGNIGALGPPASLSSSELYVPSTTSTSAGTRQWATQIVSWNRGTPDSAGARKSIDYTARLLPTEWITGYSPAAVSSVAAGSLLYQNDVLTDVIKAPGGSGALRLLAATTPEDFFSWARVYFKRSDGGTYGWALNPPTPSNAIGAGESAFLFTPPDPTTQRTDAGIIVVDGAKGSISVVDQDGVTRKTFTFDWPAGYHFQASTIFSFLGITPLPSARVVFTLTEGRLLPFGTSYDTGTGDPMQLAFYGPRSASTLQWILGAQRGAGTMGSASRTDLQLWNGGTTDADVTIQFGQAVPFTQTAPAPALVSRSVVAKAGKVTTLADVLGATFGMDGVNGTLYVLSSTPIVAFGRVSSADSTGRFGFGFGAVRGGDAITAGSRGVFLATTDSGWDVVQSDLHLTNPTDSPARVTLNLFTFDGLPAGSREVTLVAKETRSLDQVWYSIAGYGTLFGRLDVVPADGSAAVFATLLRRDQKTLDTDAILPQLVTR